MHTFLSDILHVVSQALLVPDIILLLFLVGYALFCIGSVLVEFYTEHRYFEVVMPKFLASLTEAPENLVSSVIQESGLLQRQKDALKTVYDYRGLEGDALIALVKRLMNEEEAHYDKITDRNAMAAKVAPMLGLMGTLIPLGPGIQALGQADTAMLSNSLLVAFDTTVAGLVAAAVCLVIGKVRSGWYNNYLSALDSAMATLLQKIEDSRIPGQPVPLPSESSSASSSESSFLFGGQPAPTASPAGDASGLGIAPDTGFGISSGVTAIPDASTAFDTGILSDPTSTYPVDIAPDMSPSFDPGIASDALGAMGPAPEGVAGGFDLGSDVGMTGTMPSGMPLPSDSPYPGDEVAPQQSSVGFVFEPTKNPLDGESAN